MARQKILTMIIVIVIIGIIAYAWWSIGLRKSREQEVQKAPQETTEKGLLPYGTMPLIESLSNPLENMPDVNPAAKANPFKESYKNPFE